MRSRPQVNSPFRRYDYFLFIILLIAFAIPARSAGAVTIKHGSYSGNGGGSNLSITGLGFQPEAVIIKASTGNNAVIRTATMTGDATKQLAAGNGLQTSRIKSLDANGFTVGTNAEVNGATTNTYYW